MDTKQCVICKERKDLQSFSKSNQRKSGYGSYCKECDNKRKRRHEAERKAADPEAYLKRRKGYIKKYRERHPDRVKESDRRLSLMRNFGITLEHYEEMLESQDGKCVCGALPGKRRLAVDHDRSCCAGRKSCGKCVRGLLCGNCNTALGLLKEDVDRMVKLAGYLDKWRKS